MVCENTSVKLTGLTVHISCNSFFAGPFAANEMAEWFSAGYFTMNLLVKRGCDERFQPLGVVKTVSCPLENYLMVLMRNLVQSLKHY